MMKKWINRKWIAWMMVVLMSIGCGLALAVDAEVPGIYTLIADGEVSGTAVAWRDGETLLTTAVIPEEATVLCFRNGVGSAVCEMTRMESGITTMKLLEASDTVNIGSKVSTDGLRYVGINANGVSVSGEVRAAAAALVNGHAALVLTIEDAMLPGAALLNADGTLAGVLMAPTGEQSQRYAAYTMESLFWMLHTQP